MYFSKKFLTVFAVCVLSAGLMAGCGNSDETADQLETQGQTSEVANPLREVSASELEIPLNVPEDAKNVTYYMVDDENGAISQAVFTYQGKEFTYRAQKTKQTKAYDISGQNYIWSTGNTTVGTFEGVVETCSEAAAVYWLDQDAGVNYSLGCSQSMVEEDILSVAALLCDTEEEEETKPETGAAEEKPEPTKQEEKPSSEKPKQEVVPESGQNYIGEYLNENGDTVKMSKSTSKEYLYVIDIGLFRLASLTGEASNMDGAVEFTAEAPDGSMITGAFYPAEDGTYTLTITDSSWSLMPTNTSFKGFKEV